MELTLRRISLLAFSVALLAAPACDGSRMTDPNAPGVLSLAVSTREAPADGATVLMVSGTVDRDTRGEARKLIFTTSAGTFTDGGTKAATVAADENGVARLGLRAPIDAGLVRVRVSAGSAERVDSVLFTRAMPEQVLVEPEKFALVAGIKNELRVTANLRRTPGTVTPLTPVSFSAYRDGTSDEVGQFGIATLSDTSGQAGVRYTAGNTTYRGRVRIVATAAGPNGPIRGEAVVEVID